MFSQRHEIYFHQLCEMIWLSLVFKRLISFCNGIYNLQQLRVLDGKKEKIFHFDHVLSPDATNEEVNTQPVLNVYDIYI